MGEAASAGGRPKAWLKGLEDQLVAIEDEDAFERGNNVVMELEMRQIWEEGGGVAILLLGKFVRDDGGIRAGEICWDRR